MRSLLSATVGVSQLREMVMAGRLLLDSRISTPNIALSSAKTRSQLAKSELPGFLLEKRWVSAPVFAQMGQVSGEVARNLFFQTAQVSKKVARNSQSGQGAADVQAGAVARGGGAGGGAGGCACRGRRVGLRRRRPCRGGGGGGLVSGGAAAADCPGRVYALAAHATGRNRQAVRPPAYWQSAVDRRAPPVGAPAALLSQGQRSRMAGWGWARDRWAGAAGAGR